MSFLPPLDIDPELTLEEQFEKIKLIDAVDSCKDMEKLKSVVKDIISQHMYIKSAFRKVVKSAIRADFDRISNSTKVD